MSFTTIDVNNIAFNTLIEGQEAAPVVMLSNSLATDLSLWDSFAASLLPQFRVFRYDQRGHGGSTATPPPYTMPQLVDDALGLLDAVGFERVHFVGISMGGVTGHGLSQLHPQRLLSLTVCDAAPKAGPAAVWEERLALVRKQGLEALVEPTLQRWFTAESMEADTPAVRKVRAMIRATKHDGFIGGVNALQSFDYSAGLESVRLPLLFVSGAHDGARPRTILEDAARVPGARTAIIPNAGHLSNIENEPAFNSAVRAFLDEAEAASG